MNKLKVVVSGIHYPLSMMSYFIRAFERREDVELVTVGPFTGDFIPWQNGMRIPMKYVKQPTVPLPSGFANAQAVNPHVVQSQLPWEPDLWLQVDAGFNFSRPKAGIVAHVATDPHVISYDRQRKECDVFFCMQQIYSKPGDKYLPYAFDPTLHYPMDAQKEYDGCLIGLHYEHRDRLVHALRGRGYKVYYSIGEIFDEYRLAYNRARIAMSWSSLDDLPARVWEAFGMGLPLLTNRVSDLSNFFVEGDHYIGFSNLNEAVDKFHDMLIHPDEMQEMANAAHRKVIDFHTWDKRIDTILETCKLR